MRSDRFAWGAGEVAIPLCATCRHKRDDATCAAFPGGIPNAISEGDFDHRQPYPGDHGIRYAPLPAAPRRNTGDTNRRAGGA